MTFKELFERYKSDEASDVEKKMIEDEIEKFEAISEYMYDDSIIDMDQTTSGENRSKQDKAKIFTTDVNKQIRRSRRSMIIFIILILSVIFILLQIVIPQVLNKFFYNPTDDVILYEKTSGESTEQVVENQLYLDYKVFSELRMPLEHRNNASAVSLGYGKYDIRITQDNFIAKEIPEGAVSGQLVRNKLTMEPSDFLSQSELWYRFPGSDNGLERDDYLESNQDFLQSIKHLEDDEPIKVIIAFKEPVSYKKMLSIEKKYDLKMPWYAIDCGDVKDVSLGFTTTKDFGYEDYNDLKYKELFMEIGDKEKNDESIMKNRFLTMLDYMNKQQKFLSIFDINYELDRAIYTKAHDYISKNDLTVYGTVTYINKKQANNIVRDNAAYYIHFKDYDQQTTTLYP